MAPAKFRAVWLREWISRIDGNSVYTTDGKVIFCEACQQKAPATQFFQLMMQMMLSVLRRVKNVSITQHGKTWLTFIPILEVNILYTKLFIYIKELPQSIVRLEKQGLSIHEALEVFANVRNQLDSAIGDKSARIREKFSFILSNNPGIEIFSQICLILSGQNTLCDISPTLLPYYKFAPLTSTDVERSFSIYKTTLAENRMSFSPKNLEKWLICNFNYE
uniref:Uncharacterized protein n=1 Tax=Meloidogyne javanica TaxID=6303 RepID=A0A915NC63_MELJA